MVNEKKLLEQFAKVLNVEVPEMEPIKEDLPIAQTPVLKKSFKDVAKEKKQKPKKVIEEVVQSASSVPVTLFDIIKEEMARGSEPVVDNIKQKPLPVIEEPIPTVVVKQVKRPKTLQEHMAENASQPQPELPKDDFVTATVKNISKAAPGEIQKVADEISPSVQKQFDLLKKSILDMQRFAVNHSQMGGGGAGDVISLDHQTATIINDHIVGRHDYYIGVAETPITITLPLTAKSGRMLIIKDEVGDCSVNNITVFGNVDNDPGGFILAENNGGIQMIFNNGGWRII